MTTLVFSAKSVLEFCTKWKSKVANSLRTRGVVGTVQHALIGRWRYYLVWHPWNPWYQSLDRRFDRRFAVDTAGVLILPELHSPSRFKGYSPTPPFLFRRLMRHLDVDYSKFVFVDFGCGKGKALLLAARLPFRQIIGIELSSKLIRIAQDNWASYHGKRRCSALQLACMDVREYPLPEEPSIYFFFDPFDAEVMQKVLENIRNSLAKAPREVYVAYLVPVLKALLDESGFLTSVKQTSWYSIYKASGA